MICSREREKMARLRDLLRTYNEKWRDKTKIIQSAINVCLDGGDLHDWLTFVFIFVIRILERKKENGNDRYFVKEKPLNSKCTHEKD